MDLAYASCLYSSQRTRAEFLAFTRKERVAAAEAELLPLPPVPLVPPASDPDKALPIEAPKAGDAIVKELTSRGISRKKALALLSNLQPGQQLIDQLEWGDDIIRRAAPGTFRNPPGLLISFVEMNLTPPSYFVSSRLRKLREAAQLQAAEDYTRKLQLETEYEDYKRERVQQYIEEELDPEQYKKLFNAHKQEVANKYKNLRLNPTSITEVAQGSLRTELMTQIPVLTFEEFSKEKACFKGGPC